MGKNSLLGFLIGCVLFFYCSILSAQNDTIKANVLFDSDSYSLNVVESTLFRFYIDSIGVERVKEVILTGHTDSDADSLYNILLSKKRVEKLSQFAQELGVESFLISTSFFGENKPIAKNDNNESKRINRRVSISIIFEKSNDTFGVAPGSPVNFDTKLCDESKDTTIILPSGSTITMKLCELIRKKECIQITEAFSPRAMDSLNLTTMIVDGTPLVSCGMIGFGYKEDCENVCFDSVVTIRIPLLEGECGYCSKARAPSLYSSNSEGGWEDKSESSQLVDINGVTYFEYQIKCPYSGMKNCDCKLGLSKKFKIKVKGKYKITSLTLSHGCPLVYYPFPANDLNHKKVSKESLFRRHKLPCFMASSNVEAIVEDKKGNSYILPIQPIESLNKSKNFNRCKHPTEKKKILGFLRFKKRFFHRVYKFGEEDLVLLQ